MPSEWSMRTRANLAHIPILPLEELRKLPQAGQLDSGVYFLWAADELLYVGKSRNLMDRVQRQAQVNRGFPFQQSTTAKYIPSDRMTCIIVETGIECSPRLDGKLKDLERAYIAAYEPPYNVDYQNGFT